MELRRATPPDAPAIAAVHVTAWQTAYRGLVPDDVLERLDAERRAADWAVILEDDSQHHLLLEDQGHISGFVTCGPARDADLDPRRTGEIYAIYVAPADWRRGFGRRLCAAAIDMLQSAGSREIALWVFERHAPARRFYEALGFRPDGASRIETRGVPLKIIRYRRAVSLTGRTSPPR
jgi:ribosomal protein S18 acetylase RimI-like enzyme